jgi:hypothetical protein
MAQANSNSARSIRKAAERARLLEMAERNTITRLMADQQARMWMWQLLSLCQMFHEYGPQEAPAANFAIGKRTIGLALLSAIQRYAPAHYITMVQENSSADLEVGDTTQDQFDV